MKSSFVVRLLGAAIVIAALPLPCMAHSVVGIGLRVGYPPPAIPLYQQPYVPGPNYVWVPGYWSSSQHGYYWVPGTWTYAPRSDYLWTPGYWGWNGGDYAWHQGYWGTLVGYYGGVNYGAGYYGDGYVGGHWSGNTLRYNTYVTRVGPGFRGSVYTDRTVYVNTSTTSNVGYNGGPNGLRARPSRQQLAVWRAHHLGMTAAQQQHVQVAAQDRNMLASVNHGHPAVTSVAVLRAIGTFHGPAVRAAADDKQAP